MKIFGSLNFWEILVRSGVVKFLAEAKDYYSACFALKFSSGLVRLGSFGSIFLFIYFYIYFFYLIVILVNFIVMIILLLFWRSTKLSVFPGQEEEEDYRTSVG